MSDITLIQRGGGKRPYEARQPTCAMQEGCQFRRSIPRDEGNELKRQTPEKQGFFCAINPDSFLQTCSHAVESISYRMTTHSYVCTITFGEEGASF
ncbi:hypothetical protein KSF_058220 [Reticulibacter mediterranei]|uniref:Uncharacterized protein n=1 Tax=Reticulibacter mediterranei TaxID=2778369 RepID=A0A8J3IHQ8_9CHLR|nr:hypothetical protein KSF_058220 [Reticulibacter mediterranei]